MVVDHSGDRPAAPTPREQGFQQRLTTVRDDALALTALLREAGIAFDYNHEALFADSLVYLLATVERLEAAEQAKAGRGERGAEPMMADAAAALVPPSPPAADETVVHTFKPVADRDDTDLVNLVEQLHTRAAATNAKPVHDAWVEARNELLCRLQQLRRDLAEAKALMVEEHKNVTATIDTVIQQRDEAQETVRLFQITYGEPGTVRDLATANAQLARLRAEAEHGAGTWRDMYEAAHDDAMRLRARLADGVRGKVVDRAKGLGGQRSYRIHTHVTAKSWSTGDFVLVLPDEPEGLTTDSTNPEPGRGTK